LSRSATRPGVVVALLGLSALVGCPQRHVYPDGGGLVGQLNREVAALRQTVTALEYEAATCRDGRAGPDPLYQELHQILSRTEVSVERLGRITRVTLPAAHLFGVDELSLRAEAEMTLDLMATALKLHPTYRIDIEGHTDDRGVPPELRGRFDNAWLFTSARAWALASRLIREGVQPQRIGVVGRGASEPTDSNDTDTGRRNNRRVVIYLVPDGGLAR